MKSHYQIISKELDEKERLLRIIASTDRFESPLVINCYPLKGNASLTEQYESVAKTLEETPHPNLAQTFEHWVEADTFYIAQELLRGPDLETFAAGSFAKKGFVRCLVKIFKGLSWALDSLHMSGLSHGRITAGQIRIVEDDKAKLPYSSLSQDSKSVGQLKRKTASQNTMAAISPEEWAGSSPDYLTDVFALGSVMKLTLTRISAPNNKSPGGTAASLITSDPLYAPLQTIVTRAMHEDRAKRIHSARKLAGELSMLDIKAS